MTETRTLIVREMRAARVHARRAIRAVAAFGSWLLVTWIGPGVLPEAGWSLWATAGVTAAYAVLTCAALVCVWWTAVRVLFAGVLRRVVTAHLAPFWMVLSGALCGGGAVYRAVHDPIAGVWLGLGTALCVLTACYWLARVLEIRELSVTRDQLDHAPSEVALRTFSRELGARLEAAASVRLDG